MKIQYFNSYLTLFIGVILVGQVSLSQGYAAFTDYSDRFFAFKEGEIIQLETLEVNDFKVTKDKVVYLNNQNDLMLFNNQGKEKIDYNAENLKAKDGLVAYTSATAVKVLDNNKSTKFTFNKGDFWVGDNLAFCEDQFNGVFKVFDQGQPRPLIRGIYETQTTQVTVGENLGVYRFSSNQYKLYWDGDVHEIINYDGDIEFQCGRDMAAFNDPVSNTFVVFYQGEFLDVESQHAQSFRVADNLLVYVDVAGNFKVFDPSHFKYPESIANYGTKNYQVDDDVVGFIENGWLKYYSEGKTMQVVNYIPQKWRIDEQHMVYLDQNGWVKAIINGEEKEITTEKVKDFKLYNDCIVIIWVNETSSVYWNGKMYDSY